MKYGMLPKGMWLLFKGSFTRAAQDNLGVRDGKKMMKQANEEYRRIVSAVDEFDPDSRFVTNILSCAMLIAVLKQLPEKPAVEDVKKFYHDAMCNNKAMRKFVKRSKNYSPKGQEKLRLDALKSQKRTNPYEWKFTYTPGETINQYTATFTTCGICVLMKEHGLYEYVPAMCVLDYDTAAMNNSVFTRQYTLASGGPHCDCHYDHHEK